MDTDIWRRSATGLLDGADILQEVHAETPKDRSLASDSKMADFMMDGECHVQSF